MSEYLTLSPQDQASPIYQNEMPQQQEPLLKNTRQYTNESAILADAYDADRPSTSTAIPSSSNNMNPQYQLLSECSETSV